MWSHEMPLDFEALVLYVAISKCCMTLMSQHGSRSLCCSSSMPQGIVKKKKEKKSTQYQRRIALQNYTGSVDTTDAFAIILKGLTAKSKC